MEKKTHKKTQKQQPNKSTEKNLTHSSLFFINFGIFLCFVKNLICLNSSFHIWKMPETLFNWDVM